ncbi:MAG: TolB family protein [Cyclobacteriaceae bacterium]
MTKYLSTALLIFSVFHMTLNAQLIDSRFSVVRFFGDPLKQPVSIYKKESQTYELGGSGSSAGQGIMISSVIEGDFLLSARISDSGTGDGGLALADTEGKLLAIAVINKTGAVILKILAENKILKGPKENYQIIRLEKDGNKITVYAAGRFEPLQKIAEHAFTRLPDVVTTGPYFEANGTTSKVILSEVRLDRLVPYNYDGDKSGHFGSRLEIIDVISGERKIVFESPDRFEAPNFLPDGKQLLFNMNGLLYTIPVTGGTPKQFNTGFANRNNNDHGISFDGKLLAISHHRDGLPGYGSTVYVLPVTGGEPKLVTELTPSYWHGWSPNNKEVLYVAQRNGSARFQLYKKDIFGGPETALTSFDKGHVDGPEFSPDGKFIYYNGSQTGTMQLWRMDPDGKNHEQLTFDELNNWFPHISPDGKLIAWLAFPSDIHPDEHPAYKKVQLRIMSSTGGTPRVLTHLFGGQGTINVPSWSPDNRYIAFVSYSEPKKK